MVGKKILWSSSNTGFYILASLHNTASPGLGTKQFHKKFIDLAVLSDSPRSKAVCCFQEANPIPGCSNQKLADEILWLNSAPREGTSWSFVPSFCLRMSTGQADHREELNSFGLFSKGAWRETSRVSAAKDVRENERGRKRLNSLSMPTMYKK